MTDGLEQAISEFEADSYGTEYDGKPKNGLWKLGGCRFSECGTDV